MIIENDGFGKFHYKNYSSLRIHDSFNTWFRVLYVTSKTQNNT